MNILLINIDSKIPNVALKKIEFYYLQKGSQINWDLPLLKSWADKIFVSCIYTWNKDRCREWEGIAEIGGSGYDLLKKLPDEIEKVKPKINIGFTTRGCIRRCYFCVVSQKEGNIKIVGDIYDIWDRIGKDIMLLDNNILAVPDHFFKICSQLKKEKLRVDFNQGLDFRLLTDKIVKELSEIRHKEYHFAFDDIRYEKKVLKAITLLRKHGINRSMWYLYCDSKNDFKDAYYRANLLKRNNQNGFVQRDRDVYYDRRYIGFARWVNMHSWFQRISFFEFLTKYRNDYYKEFSRDEIEYIKINQV